MKTCKKCGETKEITEFSKYWNGISNLCKKCKNSYYSGYISKYKKDMKKEILIKREVNRVITKNYLKENYFDMFRICKVKELGIELDIYEKLKKKFPNATHEDLVKNQKRLLGF